MEPDTFAPADDDLHEPSDNFYETETYWYSFFVPERGLGAWLYTSVKTTVGETAGGMWIWDTTATNPWELPFYQYFEHLKPPRTVAPGHLEFPTGMSVRAIEPGMVYEVGYDDRKRAKVALRFEGVEPPVPLRSGAPPYPKASHYDQTGRVTGTLELDGETVEIDCVAMRDRSWGPRYERGYTRVGYTWAGSDQLSFLTYTSPEGVSTESEHIHSGYVRRGAGEGAVTQIEGGTRTLERDAEHGWLTGITAELVDEEGRKATAVATAVSRMVLPAATSICINSALRWTVTDETGDTVELAGEDQDVWPIDDWRRFRAPRLKAQS